MSNAEVHKTIQRYQKAKEEQTEQRPKCMEHTELYRQITELVRELLKRAANGDEAARNDLWCLAGYTDQAAKEERSKRNA